MNVNELSGGSASEGAAASGERFLAWLLRLMGATESLALAAVFMPQAMMATIHARLGMGTLPDAAVVDYLTRSLSGLYTTHGFILLYLSFHVRRNLGVIEFWGAVTLVYGVILIGIDIHAGLPWFWVLLEGPVVALMGALMQALSRRIASGRRSA